MRRRHALIGLLLLYVAMDFANPMMPGAFEFEPAESVEALRGERNRVIAPTDLPAPNPLVVSELPPRPREEGVVRNPFPAELFIPVKRAHLLAAGDSASPGDDH